MFLTRCTVIPATLAVGLLMLSAAPAIADDAKVMGKVVLKGKALGSGRITFHLDNGQFYGSRVKDGDYALDLVPAGLFKVTIEGQGIPAVYASEKTSPLTVTIRTGKNAHDINLQP